MKDDLNIITSSMWAFHLHTVYMHLITVAVLAIHCYTTMGEGSPLLTMTLMLRVEAVLSPTKVLGGSTIASNHISTGCTITAQLRGTRE